MTCEQCAEHPFAGQNTQHTALRGANSAATGSLPAWVSLSNQLTNLLFKQHSLFAREGVINVWTKKCINNGLGTSLYHHHKWLLFGIL